MYENMHGWVKASNVVLASNELCALPRRRAVKSHEGHPSRDVLRLVRDTESIWSRHVQAVGKITITVQLQRLQTGFFNKGFAYVDSGVGSTEELQMKLIKLSEDLSTNELFYTNRRLRKIACPQPAPDRVTGHLRSPVMCLAVKLAGVLPTVIICRV